MARSPGPRFAPAILRQVSGGQRMTEARFLGQRNKLNVYLLFAMQIKISDQKHDSCDRLRSFLYKQESHRVHTCICSCEHLLTDNSNSS